MNHTWQRYLNPDEQRLAHEYATLLAESRALLEARLALIEEEREALRVLIEIQDRKERLPRETALHERALEGMERLRREVEERQAANIAQLERALGAPDKGATSENPTP